VKNECVMCGYCCSKRPCIHGTGSPCVYLVDNKCAKYEEIKILESNDPYPMFGCGCSSSLFNTRRDNAIREREKVLSPRV